MAHSPFFIADTDLTRGLESEDAKREPQRRKNSSNPWTPFGGPEVLAHASSSSSLNSNSLSCGCPSPCHSCLSDQSLHPQPQVLRQEEKSPSHSLLKSLVPKKLLHSGVLASPKAKLKASHSVSPKQCSDPHGTHRLQPHRTHRAWKGNFLLMFFRSSFGSRSGTSTSPQ